MTSTQANTTAAAKLSKCSIKTLLEMWHHSDKLEIDAAVARTRGWIMDAMEAKNLEAFDRWMSDENGADPDQFFA